MQEIIIYGILALAGAAFICGSLITIYRCTVKPLALLLIYIFKGKRAAISFVTPYAKEVFKEN